MDLTRLSGRRVRAARAARPRRDPADAVKRALDVVGAVVLLLASAPLHVLIVPVLLITQGAPILFRQVRVGLNDGTFVMLKYRTMRPPTVSETGAACDAARITAAGGFLRRTSLDELPSLLNVIVGDMSVVGPRPLPADYLEIYTPEQRRRHLVRPGVTGLAQVSGRNALPWRERLALDVEYVDTRSLLLDARIIWRTLRVVWQREGISEPGHATSSVFDGTSAT